MTPQSALDAIQCARMFAFIEEQRDMLAVATSPEFAEQVYGYRRGDPICDDD